MLLSDSELVPDCDVVVDGDKVLDAEGDRGDNVLDTLVESDGENDSDGEYELERE